jgi:hypothetical protein
MEAVSPLVVDPAEGKLYPRHVLEGAETALCVFAAAFLGRQDAHWLNEAGLQVDCIDIDLPRLERMKALYPESWRYLCVDAFDFAKNTGGMWDVVSVDCPTGAFQRCADMIGTWCDLARQAVILGTGHDTALTPPPGWKLTDFRRRSDFKGGVYWAVLERA